MRKARIGELLAHIVAEHIGTWTFVFWQFVIMCVWIGWNVFALIHRFDPYPFILGNLAMSAEAAFTGPVLLIADNYNRRREEEHRRKAERQTAEILRLLTKALEEGKPNSDRG